MQQARSNKNVSAKSYMRGYREIYDVIKPIHSEMSISRNARSIRFTFAYSMTIFQDFGKTGDHGCLKLTSGTPKIKRGWKKFEILEHCVGLYWRVW